MIDYENGASGWSLHPVSFGDQKGMTEEEFLSGIVQIDRKSTRLNFSHVSESRMPSSA